jgi:hypothetical protein
MVFAALGYDHIGKFLGRFYELVMHGFDHCISRYHVLYAPPPLHHVPVYDPYQPVIGLGIYEYFDIT